jgi:hypothetical protein
MFAMLISASEPSLYLLVPSDIRNGSLPEPAESHRGALEEVVRWSHEYLCHGHSELGRGGPVCPYARPSLERELLWLTVHPGADPPLDELSAAVDGYGRWFQRLPPRSGRDAQYKAILILLPDLPPERAPDIVDTVHAARKPGFVAEGLMLGQFYATCDRPGLWNRRFRPLRSTVPLLTIRHMVPPDAGFLDDEARFLTAYLARFGDAVPSRLQGAVRQASLRLGLNGRRP